MKMPSVKQAFAWHFSISLAIFLLLIWLMVRFWFPGDLFLMDGGWQGLKIIAPIDLILGPALTLLFYRPWKKSLKFDMAMIATVQILALGFGVYTAYHQRTAAIVFAENRFETLSLNEFKAAQAELREQNLPARPISDFGRMPIMVYAESFGSEGYGKYLEDIMNGLPELRERSDRYHPLAQSMDKIAKFQISTQADGTTIEEPQVAAAKPPESQGTYEIKARYLFGTIKFDGDNYKIERKS